MGEQLPAARINGALLKPLSKAVTGLSGSHLLQRGQFLLCKRARYQAFRHSPQSAVSGLRGKTAGQHLAVYAILPVIVVHEAACLLLRQFCPVERPGNCICIAGRFLAVQEPFSLVPVPPAIRLIKADRHWHVQLEQTWFRRVDREHLLPKGQDTFTSIALPGMEPALVIDVLQSTSLLQRVSGIIQLPCLDPAARGELIPQEIQPLLRYTLHDDLSPFILPQV